MSAPKANQTTARAYAQALLDLAEQQKQAEPIGQELRDTRQIVTDTPGLSEYLADPGVGGAERWNVVQKAFEGRVSPLLMNFLRVLNNHGRLRLLTATADAYDELLEKLMGIVEVDVTVAHRLSDEQMEQVRQRVGAALGKKAVIHQYVDDRIIGGLVLRVEDRLIDASVRYQLQAIRQQLAAALPKQPTAWVDTTDTTGGAQAY